MRFAGANKAVDAIGVAVVDQHAHGGIQVERIARLPALLPALLQVEKAVGDALLKQQTGTGDTDLALIVENTAGSRVDRFLQVRAVGKDDIGALPPASSQTRFILLSPASFSSVYRCRWSR